MKLKILIVAFFSCLMAANYCYADGAKEEVIIIQDKPGPVDPKSKPRVPAKKNVEAWIDGNVMTIIFNNPEGEAVVTLESSEGIMIDELTYSTEAPIVVDLTPYDGVAGFTLTTESGHTYIGYLNH